MLTARADVGRKLLRKGCRPWFVGDCARYSYRRWSALAANDYSVVL